MNLKYRLIGWAILGVGVVAAVACGGNDCDRASDKLTSCGLQSGVGGSGGAAPQADCSGVTQCAAGCINAATCDDITQGYQGKLNAFAMCQQACKKAQGK